MMIYLKLLLSFFKIGLFSFGGGYAMIPLIQKELEINGWLCPSEFIDILAVAEMTPGPIAVNAATFVGYETAGTLGSLVATVGVALPSLILILAVSGFFFKMQREPINIMMFYGIRPIITGLIAAAGVFIAETALFSGDATNATVNTIFNEANNLYCFDSTILLSEKLFNGAGITIMVITLIALIKYKLHPILAVAGAGITGVFLYSVVPILI